MKTNCTNCGHKLKETLSQCKNCGYFNVWEQKDTGTLGQWLADIARSEHPRLPSGPWDWSLGGGLLPDTVVMLGGVPGAGKSTLLLQWVGAWAKRYEKGYPLYVASEESLETIAIRADRLKVKGKIRFFTPLDFQSFDTEKASDVNLIVLDSLHGIAGDDSVIQESICTVLKTFAMRHKCPVIITSHVTKDDLLAGKMTIQHLVDATCMIYLEDDVRVMTCLKSRIGPAFNETLFDMTEHGLKFVGKRPEEKGLTLVR
jgi:DNA repair protein RadA/Sms